MPLNEIERHPFLTYYQTPETSNTDFSGLIIGSFPIYAITDTLNNALDVVLSRFNLAQARMKFFYGSNDSDFWQYCSEALGEDINPALPQPGDILNEGIGSARQRCIDLLHRHKLLMTDVIKQTNRNGEGSEDKHLWKKAGAPAAILQHLQLNNDLPPILNQYPTIRNLYFTATGQTGKCPFGWFKTIFGHHLTETNQIAFNGRPWSSVCTIDGQQYNAFFLPTPKPRGVHFGDNRRSLQFINYLQHHDPVFYNQISPLLQVQRTINQEHILSAHRQYFLVESYRQAMVCNHRHFNGAVLND